MSQLDDYFTVMIAALNVIQQTILSLDLYFLNRRINLQMIIGLAFFTAIINALVHPKNDEYDNLGD